MSGLHFRMNVFIIKSQLISPESVGYNVGLEAILGRGEDMSADRTPERVQRAAGAVQRLSPSASHTGVVAELLPADRTTHPVKDSHGFK